MNRNVDVHVKDQDGRQPLMWAASSGKLGSLLHKTMSVFNSVQDRPVPFQSTSHVG